MKKGLFIVIEGGEGVGKSTQIKLLVKRLRSLKQSVLTLREPGATRIGEQIRAITHNVGNSELAPETEAYLMAAARAQNVAQNIRPALLSAKIVICDRFIDSSIAYQGYGRKLGADQIRDLNKLATGGLKPDLTILLDLPVKLGLVRRDNTHKTPDRLDQQSAEFYQRVREGFQLLAKTNSSGYLVIDASKSIGEVSAQIWDSVQHLTIKKRNGKT